MSRSPSANDSTFASALTVCSKLSIQLGTAGEQVSLASPRHATVYDVLEEAKPKVPPFAMGDLDDSELPSLEALVAEVCGGKLANELTGAIQSAKEQPAATQQPTGGLNLDHFSTAQLRAHLAESNNMKKKSGTSSRLRGVTKHCTTGKYEAHLWDPEKKRPPGSAREKGVQVYLGGWVSEMHAALVYDIAYYKFWGHCAKTNLPQCVVEQALPPQFALMTMDELASMLKAHSQNGCKANRKRPASAPAAKPQTAASRKRQATLSRSQQPTSASSSHLSSGSSNDTETVMMDAAINSDSAMLSAVTVGHTMPTGAPALQPLQLQILPAPSAFATLSVASPDKMDGQDALLKQPVVCPTYRQQMGPPDDEEDMLLDTRSLHHILLGLGDWTAACHLI